VTAKLALIYGNFVVGWSFCNRDKGLGLVQVDANDIVVQAVIAVTDYAIRKPGDEDSGDVIWHLAQSIASGIGACDVGLQGGSA
jgi:hypothetical protein